MYFDPILMFIYELIDKKIKIWVQNENIELFVPEEVFFTNDQKQFIKNNKIGEINDNLFEILLNLIPDYTLNMYSTLYMTECI